jgi:RNA polymerase sigma-70 factor (ECF subfamily)
MGTQTDDEIVAAILVLLDRAFRTANWILRDQVAAEDAVHQAVLSAWARRGSLRDPTALEGWFFRILTNASKDELKRRGRARYVTWTDATLVDQAIGSGVEDRDELERAIRRLTVDEQVVIGLRYGADLAVVDIADRIGVPVGTVKSRQHHALTHLRAALEAERRAEGER